VRAVVQRVSSAGVTVDGAAVSSIGPGLLILLGIRNGDAEREAEYVAEKCASLRIFEDDEGKMNRSLRDTMGEALVVSQFTLYGDTRKGNRPSFVDAAPPQTAEPLYEHFVRHLRNLLGESKVSTGVFRAMMEVSLVNSGPVTVTVESKEP